MNHEELKHLVANGESETLEFKNSTSTRRQGTMTLCAMLNQLGGYVVYGVAPNGKIVGQNIGERTVENLSAEIQRIDPPVFPTIVRLPVDTSRELIMVRVEAGTAKPYQYRGNAYRRIGNTTVKMSSAEYGKMLVDRLHNEQRWENQPAPDWTIDKLDVAEIRNTVAEAVRSGRLNEPGNREPEDLLYGLGLMNDGVLLRAAAVLFGKREYIEAAMPQCLLRVARFRGTDRMQFLDNRQYIGNAFTLLSNAEGFLRDTIPISSRFESGRMQRIDEPLYPPLAVREALANALCHRDYSLGGGSIGLAIYDDRLEVASIGGLHFGLTPSDLFDRHESKPWNPLIARTFYRRGVIEEWGTGITKMADLADLAGLPKLEIEDINDCVTVRFRNNVNYPKRDIRILSKQQQAIMDLLSRIDHDLALREILAQLGNQANERQIRRDLYQLKSKGLIENTGHGRGSRWKAI